MFNTKARHQIFEHCNMQDVLKLQYAVNGMKIKSKENSSCDVCLHRKMSQYRNRAPDDKARNILDMVHCDLSGPIYPAGRDGFKYAISFVDDFSGMLFVYLLKSKSDTRKALNKINPI